MPSITGVIIRDRTIEWTVLSEDTDGSVQRFSKTVLLDVDEAGAGDVELMASAIQQQCPDLAGAVTVGIGSGHALMRVIDLPTVDTVEIDSMVQLQVDKLSPFPDEKMASSFEALKADDASCRVLIATMRRAAVEDVGGICRKAGLDVRRIDVEAMGWWRLLRDENIVLDSGRQVMIVMEHEGGAIIAQQDGVPASFKTISPADGLPEEEYAAEIADEVRSMVLALDLEHGEAPVARMDFLHRDPKPERIIERLNADFGKDLRVESLEALPCLSEGLARRAMNPPFSFKTSRGIHSVIDLVPAAWRTAAEAALFKRQAIAVASVILGVWLIAITLLGIGYRVRLRRLGRIEDRMASIQGPADEVRALQRRVNAFEQHLDRKQSALECLREISRMLPEEVTLTSFQVRKGRNVVVRGESLVVDSIIDFKQQLDASTLFESIDMGAIQPRQRRNQTVQTFHMDARLPEET